MRPCYNSGGNTGKADAGFFKNKVVGHFLFSDVYKHERYTRWLRGCLQGLIKQEFLQAVSLAHAAFKQVAGGGFGKVAGRYAYPKLHRCGRRSGIGISPNCFYGKHGYMVSFTAKQLLYEFAAFQAFGFGKFVGQGVLKILLHEID